MSVILTLDEVKKLWRGTVLGVMTWHASVHGVNPDLWTFYAESVQPGLFGKLQSTELSAMSVMSDNRRAFKSFGIDPGRTRRSTPTTSSPSLPAFPLEATIWPGQVRALSSAWAGKGRPMPVLARAV